MSQPSHPLSILGDVLPVSLAFDHQPSSIALKSGPELPPTVRFLPYTVTSCVYIPSLPHPLHVFATADNNRLTIGTRLFNNDDQDANTLQQSFNSIFQRSFITTSSIIPNTLSIFKHLSRDNSKIYITFLTENCCLNVVICSLSNSLRTMQDFPSQLNFLSNPIHHVLEGLHLPTTFTRAIICAIATPYIQPSNESDESSHNPLLEELYERQNTSQSSLQLLQLLATTMSFTLDHSSQEMWVFSSPFSPNTIAATLLYDDTHLALSRYTTQKKSHGLLASFLSPLFSSASSSSSSSSSSSRSHLPSKLHPMTKHTMSAIPTLISSSDIAHSGGASASGSKAVSDIPPSMLSFSSVFPIRGVFVGVSNDGTVTLFDASIDDENDELQQQHGGAGSSSHRNRPLPRGGEDSLDHIDDLPVLTSIPLEDIPPHVRDYKCVVSAKLTIQDPYIKPLQAASSSPPAVSSSSVDAMLSCIYYDPCANRFHLHTACLSIVLSDKAPSYPSPSSLSLSSNTPTPIAVRPIDLEGQPSSIIITPLFSQTTRLSSLCPSLHSTASDSTMHCPIITNVGWNNTRTWIQLQCGNVQELVQLTYPCLPLLYISSHAPAIPSIVLQGKDGHTEPQAPPREAHHYIVSAIHSNHPFRPTYSRVINPYMESLPAALLRQQSFHLMSDLLTDRVLYYRLTYTKHLYVSKTQSKSNTSNILSASYGSITSLSPLAMVALSRSSHGQTTHSRIDGSDSHTIQSNETLYAVRSDKLIAHIMALLACNPSSSSQIQPSLSMPVPGIVPETSFRSSLFLLAKILRRVNTVPSQDDDTGMDVDDVEIDIDIDDDDDDLHSLLFNDSYSNGDGNDDGHNQLILHLIHFTDVFIPLAIQYLYSGMVTGAGGGDGKPSIDFVMQSINHAFIRSCAYLSQSSPGVDHLLHSGDDDDPNNTSSQRHRDRYRQYATHLHDTLFLLLSLSPLYLQIPQNYPAHLGVATSFTLASDLAQYHMSRLDTLESGKAVPGIVDGPCKPNAHHAGSFNSNAISDGNHQKQARHRPDPRNQRKRRRRSSGSLAPLHGLNESSFLMNDTLDTSLLASVQGDAGHIVADDTYVRSVLCQYLFHITSSVRNVIGIVQFTSINLTSPPPSPSANNLHQEEKQRNLHPSLSMLFETFHQLQSLSESSLEANKVGDLTMMDNHAQSIFSPWFNHIFHQHPLPPTTNKAGPHDNPVDYHGQFINVIRGIFLHTAHHSKPGQPRPGGDPSLFQLVYAHNNHHLAWESSTTHRSTNRDSVTPGSDSYDAPELYIAKIFTSTTTPPSSSSPSLFNCFFSEVLSFPVPTQVKIAQLLFQHDDNKNAPTSSRRTCPHGDIPSYPTAFSVLSYFASRSVDVFDRLFSISEFDSIVEEHASLIDAGDGVGDDTNNDPMAHTVDNNGMADGIDNTKHRVVVDKTPLQSSGESIPIPVNIALAYAVISSLVTSPHGSAVTAETTPATPLLTREDGMDLHVLRDVLSHAMPFLPYLLSTWSSIIFTSFRGLDSAPVTDARHHRSSEVSMSIVGTTHPRTHTTNSLYPYTHLFVLLNTVWSLSTSHMVSGISVHRSANHHHSKSHRDSHAVDLMDSDHGPTALPYDAIHRLTGLLKEIYFKLSPPQPLAAQIVPSPSSIIHQFISVMFTTCTSNAAMFYYRQWFSDQPSSSSPTQATHNSLALSHLMSTLQPLWAVSFPQTSQVSHDDHHRPDCISYGMALYTFLLRSLLATIVPHLNLDAFDSVNSTNHHQTPMSDPPSSPSLQALELFLIDTTSVTHAVSLDGEYGDTETPSPSMSQSHHGLKPLESIWTSASACALNRYLSHHFITMVYHQIRLHYFSSPQSHSHTNIDFTHVDTSVALLSTAVLAIGQLQTRLIAPPLVNLYHSPSHNTSHSIDGDDAIVLPNLCNYNTLASTVSPLSTLAAPSLSLSLPSLAPQAPSPCSDTTMDDLAHHLFASDYLHGRGALQTYGDNHHKLRDGNAHSRILSIVELYITCVMFNQDVLSRLIRHYHHMFSQPQPQQGSGDTHDTDESQDEDTQHNMAQFFTQYHRIISVNNTLLSHTQLVLSQTTVNLLPHSLLVSIDYPTTFLSPASSPSPITTVAVTPFSFQCMLSTYQTLATTFTTLSSFTPSLVHSLYRSLPDCFYNNPYDFVDLLIDHGYFMNASNLMALFSGETLGMSFNPSTTTQHPDSTIIPLHHHQQTTMNPYLHTMLLSQPEVSQLSKKLLRLKPVKPHQLNITSTLPGFYYGVDNAYTTSNHGTGSANAKVSAMKKTWAIQNGLWFIRSTPVGQQITTAHLGRDGTRPTTQSLLSLPRSFEASSMQ